MFFEVKLISRNVFLLLFINFSSFWVALAWFCLDFKYKDLNILDHSGHHRFSSWLLLSILISRRWNEDVIVQSLAKSDRVLGLFAGAI